jgi:hypothetical protein
MAANYRFIFGISILATLQSPLLWAQDSSLDRAQLLFQRGRDSLKNGRLQDAMRDLTESQRLDPKPGTLLNLALCEEKLGLLVEARAHLHQFEDVAQRDDDRRPLATRHLVDIDDKLPRVTIRLGPEGAPAIVVRLDGRNLEKGELKSPLPVDPGEHDLVLVRPDGKERRIPFHIEERQQLLQIAEWTDAAESPRAPSGSPSPATGAARQSEPEGSSAVGDLRESRRLAGLILGGVGVAAAGGAALSAIEVLKYKKIVEEHCDARGCNADALAAAGPGKTWSTVGTVTGIAAVAFIGTGAYLLLVDGASRPRGVSARHVDGVGLTVGPFGATLAGSF